MLLYGLDDWQCFLDCSKHPHEHITMRADPFSSRFNSLNGIILAVVGDIPKISIMASSCEYHDDDLRGKCHRRLYNVLQKAKRRLRYHSHSSGE